jgi:hypothetical protein
MMHEIKGLRGGTEAESLRRCRLCSTSNTDRVIGIQNVVRFRYRRNAEELLSC